MSLARSDRRLSVPPLGRLEGQGSGSVGGGGSELGVSDPFLRSSTSFAGYCSLRKLFPLLGQGESSSRGDLFAHNQRSCRTRFSLPGLLQSPLRSLEDFGLLAPGYRPFGAEQVCAPDPVQDGNQSVGPPICQEERLDGLHRPQFPSILGAGGTCGL